MQKSEHSHLYSIGDISKQYHISIKTLRYYDEIGLLKPGERNDQNGYRYYTNKDIGTLLTIKYYQETGLSLAKIKDFLETTDLSDIIELFEDALVEKEQELNRIIINKDSLAAWKNLIEEGQALLKEKKIDFRIKKIPLLHTLSEGYIINNSREKKQISLKQKSEATGQLCYGAYYREFESFEKILTREQQYCFNHMEIHPLSFRNIDCSQLGNCIVLSGIHKGDTETICSTYKDMLKYAKSRELSLAGDSIERYIIDATTTANRQHHVTEIMLPLA